MKKINKKRKKNGLRKKQNRKAVITSSEAEIKKNFQFKKEQERFESYRNKMAARWKKFKS
jgi:hypothetical protein